MKKFFTMLLFLFSAFSIAMAQPAMLPIGSENVSATVESLFTCEQQGVREVLPVEIVSLGGEHFPRPVTELFCPGGAGFKTLEQYDWYLWETTFEITGGIIDQWEFRCRRVYSGYVKVTVGDTQGNVGVDSIWFNIKESRMLENFLMEIGDDLYPTFSGIALPEHVRLRMFRYNHGASAGHQQFMLEPGYWEYKDENAYYQDGELWEYMFQLLDTCYSVLEYDILGMLLETSQVGDDWKLLTKTELSQNGGLFGPYEFVYLIYTIDEFGERHPFIQGDQPVKLDQYTSEWTIPGPHVDPYYQCGVARILEDGTFELLSLSNKVPNPLIDPTGIGEQIESVCIYPNPTNNVLFVETRRATSLPEETYRIVNPLGQTVMEGQITTEKQQIDVRNLPKGVYFITVGDATRKFVVE